MTSPGEPPKMHSALSAPQDISWCTYGRGKLHLLCLRPAASSCCCYGWIWVVSPSELKTALPDPDNLHRTPRLVRPALLASLSYTPGLFSNETVFESYLLTATYRVLPAAVFESGEDRDEIVTGDNGDRQSRRDRRAPHGALALASRPSVGRDEAEESASLGRAPSTGHEREYCIRNHCIPHNGFIRGCYWRSRSQLVDTPQGSSARPQAQRSTAVRPCDA